MQTGQIPSGSSQGQAQPLGNKRVQLKLAMPHAIKKVRDIPQTADDLMKLIKGNMQDDAQFTVEYEDTDGDKITITDDDDLLLAYEQAQESANGSLKLHITKVDQKLAAEVPVEKAPVEKAPVDKQNDDNMSSSSSESDDEKDDEFSMVQPKKQKKWKAHKDGQNKEHKKERKMMKKIIKHTIKHQTKELMQSLHNQNIFPGANLSAQPVFGQAQPDQINSESQSSLVDDDKKGEQAPQQDSQNPTIAMNQMMRQLGISAPGGFVQDHWDQPPTMPANDLDNKEAWTAWGQQMKRWGLRMQQHGAGQGWRKGSHGRGPGAGPWGRNLNQMQFGGGPHWNQPNWSDLGNGFRGHGQGGHGQAWEGKGGHKINRGRVVKCPQVCVVGIPSRTVYVQVEMRNNTHWPLKPGCQFVSLFNAVLKEVVEEVKIPMEQIMAMTNYTISIPLKIKESAIPCELSEKNKDFYMAMFSLQGPKGFGFGETVSVKLRIIKELEDVEIFTRVMQLIEAYPHGNYDFEETVAAYKETGYDAKQALQSIDKKRADKADKAAKTGTAEGQIQETKKNDDEMKD